MSRPAFNQPRDLWVQDGSLRDVYIAGVTLEDWRTFFRVAAQYGCSYSCEGNEKPIPEIGQLFDEPNQPHLMTIMVGRVTANCHFFTPEEIELDLDPREIHDATDHNEVIQFLEVLATSMTKKVLLTAENSPCAPYLSYDPQFQAWSIYQPQFGEK